MTAASKLLNSKFSEASLHYDKYALLQREIANELFERIILPDSDFKVLDIGVGTGYLIERFQNIGFMDGLFAIDLAIGMLNEIKKKQLKVGLVQSDARHLPFRQKSFDLIVSSLTYQWVDDLRQAFNEANRVLKHSGVFYFTIFLDNTLKELREAIVKYFDTDIKIINSIAHLPKSESVWKLLEEEKFNITKVDLKEIKQSYRNLLELLYWLKEIGANRYWSNALYRGLSSRGFIENISKYYEREFKEKNGVFATFEVLFVEAKKDET